MTVAHAWLDGWGVLVWLASAAFWVLVIAGIVALIRGHVSSPGGSGSSALRVLEERYARGEISREDFFERRSTLTEPSSTPPPASAPPDAQAENAAPAAPTNPPADEDDTRPLPPAG